MDSRNLDESIANLNYKMAHRDMHHNAEQLSLCKSSPKRDDLKDIIALRQAHHVKLKKRADECWKMLMKTKGF